MNRLLTLLLCAFFGFTSLAQDTAKENRIYEMKYKQARKLLDEPQQYAYKTKAPETQFKLENNLTTADTLEMIFNVLKDSAALSIKVQGPRTNLIMNTEVPGISQTEDLMVRSKRQTTSIFTVDLVEMDLKDANGAQLTPQGRTSTSSSGNYRIIESDGDKRYHYFKYNTSTKIGGTEVTEPVTGNATFKVRYITGYNTVSLTSASINQTFQLGENEYRLINIHHNKAVLEVIKETQTGQKVVTDLKLISLSENGQEEYLGYTSREIKKLKAEDPAYKDFRLSSVTSMTIDKKGYDLFKGNEDLTLEGYKSGIPIEDIRKLIETKKPPTDNYVVLVSQAPLSNFTIMKPVYGEKTFTVSF